MPTHNILLAILENCCCRGVHTVAMLISYELLTIYDQYKLAETTHATVFAYMKLCDVRPFALWCRYHFHFHNLYGVRPCTVSGCHIAICGGSEQKLCTCSTTELLTDTPNASRAWLDGWLDLALHRLQTLHHSQHWVTAPAMVRSRYSRYMLWVPLRESYRSHIPTFLIFKGDLSFTWNDGNSKRRNKECHGVTLFSAQLVR